MQNKEQTKETNTKKKHVISNVKVTVHENKDSEKGEMVVDDAKEKNEAPEKTEAVQYSERESSNDALIGGDKPCCCQGFINFIKTHLILSIIIGIIILIIILLAILLPILLTKSDDDIEKKDEDPIIICDNCFRIYPLQKKVGTEVNIFNEDHLKLSDAVKPKYIIDDKENRENLTSSWDGKYTIKSGTEYFDVYFDKNINTCEKMFEDNDVIDKIYLQNLITNDITSTESMFEDSSYITKIKIANFTNNKITKMKKMFSGCSNLESLSIEGLDTSKTTDMSEMFKGCSQLTSLNLSNFNTDAVTSMSEMFEGCSKLTSLNMPNFNTNAVTSMSGMFKGCSKLNNLNLDFNSFITSTVTDMSEMFNGCSSLAISLDISQITLSSSATVTDMFSNTNFQKLCLDLSLTEKLTKNGLPNDLSKVNGADCPISHITIYPTDSCKGNPCKYINPTSENQIMSNIISTIITDNSDTKPTISTSRRLEAGEITVDDNTEYFIIYFKNKPTTLESLFQGITSIKKIKFDLNGSELTSFKYTFFESSISEIDFGNLDTSKLVTLEKIFYNCKSLTSLNLSTFKTKTVTNMFGVFGHCEILKTLKLPNDFVIDNAEDLTTMFYACKELESLDISMFKNNKATSMEQTFNQCYKLKSIKFSNDFKTDLVENMDSTFCNCNSLTSLNLYNWNTEKVTTMRKMFESCESLNSLILPNSPDTFNSVTTMKDMFYQVGLSSLDLSGRTAPNLDSMETTFQSSKMVTINLDSFVANKLTNLYGTFLDCANLENIKLNNFDTREVINMGGTFQGCGKLVDLNICSFDISKVTNKASLFGKCTKLKNVHVSSEIQSEIRAAVDVAEDVKKEEVTVDTSC